MKQLYNKPDRLRCPSIDTRRGYFHHLNGLLRSWPLTSRI